MVAGRHAASGDFREIRRLMTQRPHQYTIRSSDDRALASAVIAEPQHLRRRAGHRRRREAAPSRCRRPTSRRSSTRCPQLASRHGIRLLEVRPADESLESVFSYLVAR